jgi:soluble lytic murein transglycosylase-like protein
MSEALRLSSKAQYASVQVMHAIRDVLALVGVFATVFLIARALYVPAMAFAHTDTPQAAVFGAIQPAPLADGDEFVTDKPEWKGVSAYLARRYKIAGEASSDLIMAANDAGQKTGVDPLLVLAVVAVESRFNPYAESEFGAKGLMQVIPKYHLDKFEGIAPGQSFLHPATNLRVGAAILKEYIRRSGSVQNGLQWYAGAQDDASNQYSVKVLAERARLEQALKQGQRDVIAQAREAGAS